MRTRIWPIGLLTLFLALIAWTFTAHGSATAQQPGQLRPAGTELEIKELFIAGDDATQPLAWVVPFVTERSYFDTQPHCATAVLVRNLGRQAATVEVEWRVDTGFDGAFRRRAIEPGEGVFFATNDRVDAFPFRVDDNARLAPIDAGIFEFEYQGAANVYSSHPMVTASAFMYCRDGSAEGDTIASVIPLPALSVGDTRALFGES